MGVLSLSIRLVERIDLGTREETVWGEKREKWQIYTFMFALIKAAVHIYKWDDESNSIRLVP